MVKLKFILFDGVLALRISENKARYYKRVTHLLKGKPNLDKHWVKEKERFSAIQKLRKKYLETVILREKAKQGCNHESYYKLLTRCRADIPGFDTMVFSIIDCNKMIGIVCIFARKRAYRNTAKSFRALLGRTHKDKNFNLYAYVFRHTAITVAINNGLPISYIANAAGTSV